MLLASQFYSSGTFWAASGTITAVAIGITSILVIWLQGNPIRSLRYGMSTAPLLQEAAQSMPAKLQVTYDGKPVKEPHILEVTLSSRGRQDIAGGDFDSQPLDFKVGAQVLALLRTTCSPGTGTFNAVRFADDTLKVGPGNIGRRQTIKFTLLADGPRPELSSPATSLRNVRFEKLSVEPMGHRRTSRVLVAIGVSGAAASVAVIALLVALLLKPAESILPSQNRTLQGAIAELNSSNTNTQISGISALQNTIDKIPSDQPAAISALSAFIRKRSPAGNNDGPVTPKVQDALNVLKSRNPFHDGNTVINLADSDLTNANLAGIDLANAYLVDADLTDADLSKANLQGADLSDAYLGGAVLGGLDVTRADLSGASFYLTSFCSGSKPTQPAESYSCHQ